MSAENWRIAWCEKIPHPVQKAQRSRSFPFSTPLFSGPRLMEPTLSLIFQKAVNASSCFTALSLSTQAFRPRWKVWVVSYELQEPVGHNSRKTDAKSASPQALQFSWVVILPAEGRLRLAVFPLPTTRVPSYQKVQLSLFKRTLFCVSNLSEVSGNVVSHHFYYQTQLIVAIPNKC